MTNTLHRQGTRENLAGDYVIFSTSAAGYNKEGCAPQIKQFYQIVLRHDPVNVGGINTGNMTKDGIENILQRVNDATHATAVFDNLDTLAKVVQELKEADLGFSINISGLIEGADECCRKAGLVRHSVEHSLGYVGAVNRLPERPVLEISTMCGHGMVSFNLVKKMIELVKLGKLTPAQAAGQLARPCECGAFNPKRAEFLLEQLRNMG